MMAAALEAAAAGEVAATLAADAAAAKKVAATEGHKHGDEWRQGGSGGSRATEVWEEAVATEGRNEAWQWRVAKGG